CTYSVRLHIINIKLIFAVFFINRNSAAAELVCPDINTMFSYITALKNTLESQINYIIDNHIQYVSELSDSPVLVDYESLIHSFEDNVEVLETRLNDSLSYSLESKEMMLSALAGKLNALSPLAVLARGYSVIQKENEVVKSASQIKIKDEVTFVLQDGKAVCTVNEVSKNG
ncbi:MAG: hypothetical protein K2G22_08245, partial [Eubacterium sp.]|nr:hypothetical protein [Eubacterium sp.]